MIPFNYPSELKQLLKTALREDIQFGDVTSEYSIAVNSQGCGYIEARKNGVLCGGPIARTIFLMVDPHLKVSLKKRDGAALKQNDRILTVSGNVRSILKAERVALNFLTHLSGISTLTHEFVMRAKGTRAHIFSTRKTHPGLRLLEKYAVRCGGGKNHRMSLSDQVLVKGNHLAALKHRGETLEQMVLRVRRRFGKKMKIEIEVETLKELKNILPLSADIIMLDNMTLSQIRAAVKIVKHFKAFKPQLEVSGGVSLKTVRQIAQTGVDRIAIGALTHSAPALDMALELN